MQLTAILHFYRQFLIPTGFISLLLLFLTDDNVAFTATKILCSILVLWGYASSKRNNILHFYHNMGISKRALFLFFIGLDILLSILVIQLKTAFL